MSGPLSSEGTEVTERKAWRETSSSDLGLGSLQAVGGQADATGASILILSLRVPSDKYRRAYVRKGKSGSGTGGKEQLDSNLEGDLELSNLDDDVEGLPQVEKGVKTLE